MTHWGGRDPGSTGTDALRGVHAVFLYPVTNTVERVTGHAARPLRSWIETHRRDFQRG